MSEGNVPPGANWEINKLHPQDRAVHDWYRFVLSFPPHLVREYLVKIDWSPDPDGLVEHACQVAETAVEKLESENMEDDFLPLFRGVDHDRHYPLRTLPPESRNLLLKDSISPLPLHKTLVLLDCLKQRPDELKRGLVRSNTRGVYEDDTDDQWIFKHSEIQRIAKAIEARRLELGKTSGFERLYARVTKLYFGGMARHLAELRTILRPGALLAYVVGDQASYLRVMIRTGQLLADIARSLGNELEGIDLFRTRLATATKEQPREEVVLPRWPGKIPMPGKPLDVEPHVVPRSHTSDMTGLAAVTQ